MFVNSDLIKTTSFLIDQGERVGTVFFVEVGLGDDPRNNQFGSAFYAITARHCVDKSVAIRFPLISGGTEDKDILSADWIKHPKTDVAVLPLRFPLGSYDIKPLAFRRFAYDRNYLTRYPSSLERLDERKPALEYVTGDEIFTTGLFRQDIGPALTHPVFRFGHIALKPTSGEKIRIEIKPKEYVQVEAFLVELATWKGQSGSPIFMNPWEPEFRRPDVFEMSSREISFLVGMAQGFYPGEQEVEIDHNKALISGLNTGIGVVIPSTYIGELLMSEQLNKDRDIMLKEKSKPKPC